jgi:hypothetical protein
MAKLIGRYDLSELAILTFTRASTEQEPDNVKPGHYGDGHWEGVDLCAVPGSDERVYWIDLGAL